MEKNLVFKRLSLNWKWNFSLNEGEMKEQISGDDTHEGKMPFQTSCRLVNSLCQNLSKIYSKCIWSKHFCRYGNYFFQAFNFSLYYYFPIETWKEPNKTLEAVCPCWEIIFNQPVDWTIFCEDTRLLRTILVIGTIKLEWIYIFVIWKCTRP